MHSRTAPMWTVLNSDPKHEREFMNSFMAQSADLEDKMSSSYISRHGARTSSRRRPGPARCAHQLSPPARTVRGNGQKNVFARANVNLVSFVA